MYQTQPRVYLLDGRVTSCIKEIDYNILCQECTKIGVCVSLEREDLWRERSMWGHDSSLTGVIFSLEICIDVSKALFDIKPSCWNWADLLTRLWAFLKWAASLKEHFTHFTCGTLNVSTESWHWKLEVSDFKEVDVLETGGGTLGSLGPSVFLVLE